MLTVTILVSWPLLPLFGIVASRTCLSTTQIHIVEQIVTLSLFLCNIEPTRCWIR